MILSDADRLEPLIDDSVEAIKRAINAKGGEPSNGILKAARIATSSLATWARLKQVRNSETKTIISLAEKMAEDKAQFRDYMRGTTIAIPGTTKKALLKPKRK